MKPQVSLPSSHQLAIGTQIRGRWIRATSLNPVPLRCILILSYLLRLGLPSYIFLSVFLTKTLYKKFSCAFQATCPIYFIHLSDKQAYALCTFLLRNFLQRLAISPHFCSDIFPSTLLASNFMRPSPLTWADNVIKTHNIDRKDKNCNIKML